MAGINQFQWQELNQRRNYPFTDVSTLISGTVALPKEWAIDAIMVPNKAYESDSEFFISKVSRNGNIITLTLSSQNEELSAAILDLKASATHIKFYNILGKRYAGSLIVNPVYNVALGSFKEGDTRLNKSVATLVPSTIHPIPYPSVSAILASEGEKALSGEVYLVGGEGVTLSKSASDDNTIRIDIVGDPNYSRQDCEEEQTSVTFTELKSIVPCRLMDDGTLHVGPVVEPDEQGNFTIMPSNEHTGSGTDMHDGNKPSLRIYPKGGQLYFEIAGLGKRLL